MDLLLLLLLLGSATLTQPWLIKRLFYSLDFLSSSSSNIPPLEQRRRARWIEELDGLQCTAQTPTGQGLKPARLGGMLL
uniref:Putative secreted peptide n=1 Tax=Anopheles braziliensis TaxID=58242 RepID=A0A2M3ZXF2_9DIPT